MKPTTMVISPGAQESLWPRTMIQARIRGESAPASSNQRRIGNVSKPAQLKSPVPQMNAFGS